MQFLDDLWANVVKNMKQTYAEGFIELWFNDLKLEVLNDTDAVLVNTSDLKCKILNDKHLPTIKQYLEELLGYPVTVTILSSQNGDPDLTPYIEGRKKKRKQSQRKSQNKRSDPPSPLPMTTERLSPSVRQARFFRPTILSIPLTTLS